MMDYYSQYNGPTREEAIRIMVTKFRNVKNIETYSTLFVDDEIKQYGGLGSYTGWIVLTQKSIEDKIMNLYNSQIKIEKAKNKLKICSLFIGRMKRKRCNYLKRKYDIMNNS